MQRARFCELLAPLIGQKHREADFFLMGMFSLIDAFLDQPLDELLDQLPIPGDIKIALLGRNGIMQDICSLVISYEKGNWEEALAHMPAPGLAEGAVTDSYLASLRFANQVSSY